jgi:hypothetical protein
MLCSNISDHEDTIPNVADIFIATWPLMMWLNLGRRGL